MEGASSSLWVIPQVWIESIQQVSYWEGIVGKYGVDALRSEEIVGLRNVKGTGNSRLWGKDARADRRAMRVFPKRDGIGAGPRAENFIESLRRVAADAQAAIVQTALREQQRTIQARLGGLLSIDQAELGLELQLLKDALDGKMVDQESEETGVRDVLTGSKYSEVRVPSCLAVARDVRMGGRMRDKMY